MLPLLMLLLAKLLLLLATLLLPLATLLLLLATLLLKLLPLPSNTGLRNEKTGFRAGFFSPAGCVVIGVPVEESTGVRVDLLRCSA